MQCILRETMLHDRSCICKVCKTQKKIEHLNSIVPCNVNMYINITNLKYIVLRANQELKNTPIHRISKTGHRIFFQFWKMLFTKDLSSDFLLCITFQKSSFCSEGPPQAGSGWNAGVVRIFYVPIIFFCAIKIEKKHILCTPARLHARCDFGMVSHTNTPLLGRSTSIALVLVLLVATLLVLVQD